VLQPLRGDRSRASAKKKGREQGVSEDSGFSVPGVVEPIKALKRFIFVDGSSADV
jgi:hypothetical protein